MGKLLDLAIISSKPAANPVYQYDVLNYAGGTVTVYKNGGVVATWTSAVGVTNVPVVNGDTIRMTWTGTNGFALGIYYYINGVLQTTFTGTTSIDTGTKTVSGSNTYLFDFQGAA